MLQQKLTTATIADLKAANTLLNRAKKNVEMAGLHFPILKWPCRLISIADSSHGTKHTSYAQEAGGIFLASDNTSKVIMNKAGVISRDSEHHLGGAVHRLACFSKKSKRISHSTSHAETLAAVSTIQYSQLIALRYTELISGCTVGASKPLQVLISISDTGKYIVPIDHYTDCYDLFQLCCGMKGIPTDKTQRLSILSIREDRLCGRIRNFIHIPTNAMVVDGLTKPGTFSELLKLVSTGQWTVWSTLSKCCTMRSLVKLDTYTEDDLVGLTS